MALTKGQAQFAGELGRLTGLDPRVIGSWVLAEESGGAAAGYERRGYHNWLNIANTGSGPAGGANSPAWRSPASAARATAEWLKGQGPIAHEYGAPAAGIRAILSAAGHGAAAQINAIAGSGWASSGYNHGENLRALYHELGGQRFPAGAQQPASATGAPPSVLGTTRTVSQPQLGDPAALSALLDAVKGLSGPSVGQIAPPATTAGPTLPEGSQPIPGVAPKGPDLQALAEAALRPAQPNVESKVTQSTPGATTALPAAEGGLPKGLTDFGGKQVAAWIAPILKYAQAHGWKGDVSSGYRSRAEQERIYNSGVRPAAVPGTSNHEGTAFPRGAVDVTEAQQLAKILEGSPYGRQLVYAGSKDPVHFSHPHGGGY